MVVEKIYCACLLLCIFNGQTWGQSGQYNIPDLQLYAISPRGFRVELPDEAGVEFFAFHGKLNDRLDSSKEGDIVGDINSATNGKWVFEDPDLELRVGDRISYWVYVQYKRAGYTKRDLTWEVTELTDDTSCAPSVTAASGANKNICAGNLIFEDNFDGPRIDNMKWTVQKYIPSFEDDDHYEFVSYQDREENRFIRNSVLYLKPIPAAGRSDVLGVLDLTQGCTRTKRTSCYYQQVWGYILPPVVSAKILSKISLRYGKIEIKAKLPIGDWIYPQIELIPKNTLPSYPKILIAYARGNPNLTLNNNEDIGASLLFGGPARSPQEPQRSTNLVSKRLTVPFGNEMRTYTVIWSQSGIDFMVDNELYGTVQSHKYTGYNTEYQIALGVGVGGNYDFPDNARSDTFQKPWRNFGPRTLKDFFDQKNFWSSTWRDDAVALQIDSVKVWAL